jgi:hypothetical protein
MEEILWGCTTTVTGKMNKNGKRDRTERSAHFAFSNNPLCPRY